MFPILQMRKLRHREINLFAKIAQLADVLDKTNLHMNSDEQILNKINTKLNPKVH